jgi:hypothetical protein
MPLVGVRDAAALPQWMAAFQSRYPDATELSTCGVCHTRFSGHSARNQYGLDFYAAGGEEHPALALEAIENDDSDGDGTSNIDEIETDTGFFPGWNCDNYQSASNKPADLADFVDPTNVGCLDEPTSTTTLAPSTTTTTLPPTTTLPASTTTSTLGTEIKCAQPISTGDAPVASDCLFILNASVGLQTCTPDPCVCDPSGDSSIVATDALLCLQSAVGVPVPLECVCGSG